MPVDMARAAELYRRACTTTEKAGCTPLGWLYENGHVGAADEAAAARFYAEGCSGGWPRGCGNLAVYYEAGRGGLKRDPERARQLRARACAGGETAACQ